jgi:RNA polymerase sigma-70 factor (ECF subfamily)
MVLAAGSGNGSESRAALESLCRDYWEPVYQFVRRQGQSHEDALDRTQAYFTTLLEKDYLAGLSPSQGRFRSFLLISVRNFLANAWDHERAKKRGGDSPRISFDEPAVRAHAESGALGGSSPEAAFERSWARTVVRRAMERLDAEFRAAGQQERFRQLRGFLDDPDARPYADVAEELGVGVGGVKSMVRRLRIRFGAALRAEVAQTVGERDDVDHELRHLLQVLERS